MAAEIENEPINEAVSLNIKADTYERLATINHIIDQLESKRIKTKKG